jgi:hypothetical protein
VFKLELCKPSFQVFVKLASMGLSTIPTLMLSPRLPTCDALYFLILRSDFILIK